MSTYGYIRVSTQMSDTRANNQTFDRQLKILHDNGVSDENIFKERISGGVSTTERPEWEKLLQVVKSGDMIIVSEMSRLARSLTDLINTVNHLISMNVGIRFIKENINVSSNGLDSMNKLIFNLFGAFAEFEKDLISERTKQGLQAKKEQGVKLGRKQTYSDEQIKEILKEYEANLITIEDIAKKYSVSIDRVFVWARKYGVSRRNKKSHNNNI